MDTIGKRITQARELKGYELTKLADLIGVKADTLEAWENDERAPRANRLLRLSGALDTGFAWLMVGDDYDGDAPDVSRMASIESKLQRVKQLHKELGKLIKGIESDMEFMSAHHDEMEQLAEQEHLQ